jgi:hypothetical protein
MFGSRHFCTLSSGNDFVTVCPKLISQSLRINLHDRQRTGIGTMTSVQKFDHLVGSVLSMVRDATPRKTIEFGVIHGFCREFAEDLAPELVDILNRVEGLESLVPALERRPDLVVAASEEKSLWYFVRESY